MQAHLANLNALAGQHGGFAGAGQGSLFTGSASLNDVGQLLKAISAGHDTPVTGSTFSPSNPTGYALRPESLESSFVLTTYMKEEAQLWRKIRKIPVYNTVVEYNRLTSYGPEMVTGGFMSEGELPLTADSSWERLFAKVKFIGTLRAVTHQMGLVHTAHGDAVARETVNGNSWLIGNLERMLFFGDEAVNPTEFDGFLTQMKAGASDHIIDMRLSATSGRAGDVSKGTLDKYAKQVRDWGQHGKLDCLFYSLTAHENLADDLDVGATSSPVRYNLENVKGGTLIPGFTLNKVATRFGDLDLYPDIWLSARAYTSAQLTSGFAQGDAAKRPSSATVGTPTVQLGGTGGKWKDARTTGYKWIVVAVNESGNSDGVLHGGGGAFVKPDADDKAIRTTLNDGAVAARGYIIFRTVDGGSNFYEIDRIANSEYGTGNAMNYDDKNDQIAGATYGFAFTSAQNTFGWLQLAPPMRIPLALIDLKHRWVQVTYGTPILRAPRKCIVFKNIAPEEVWY